MPASTRRTSTSDTAACFARSRPRQKLDADTEAELFAALQRKARNDVDTLLGECDAPANVKRMLAGLLDLSGGQDALTQARAQLKGAPATVPQALGELETVAARVARRPGMPALYFDLAELSGYHYYTGVVFSAFVPGHGRAIARGGRYDGIGKAFGRERAATGFGADLRRWLKLSATAPAPLTGILAPDSEDPTLLQQVTDLRTQGERVVMWLPGEKSSAAELGCNRLLAKKGGRWIVEIIK